MADDALARLEAAQKASSRQALCGPAYDEDERFESHRLANVVEPCLQALLKAPGVTSVVIVDILSGFVIAASDPSSTATVRYAAHVPALLRKARLLSDEQQQCTLLVSTRKLDMLLMADSEHGSGAAVLVIQDLCAHGARRAVHWAPAADDHFFWPETTARGGPF